MSFEATIGAPTIDQGAGWAYVQAGATGDTGALAEWGAQVGYQGALSAPFFKPECEIAHKLTAGSHTSPAKNAAVVFKDDIRMRSINRIGLPVGL